MENDDYLLQFMQEQFKQVHNRLDQHYELFQKHTEDDRKLAEHLHTVEKEITFAKGVAYVLSGGTALGAWVSGYFK